MKDNEIIKTEDLIFDYTVFDENGDETGKNRILTDINLSIEKGSFVAVLGHNGSGKSTLAKHFNGILLPTSGKVLVDGIDTTDESRIYDIRQTVGMVFQNPDNQIIANVVEEDVGFGPENIGVPTDEIWQRVDYALRAVGMTKYRTHSPNKLSGGQKQRLAIARVIAKNPKVYLFDDSFSALDYKTDAALRKALHEQAADATVLIVAQRISTIMNAEQILVLEDGKIVGKGTHEELMKNCSAYQEIARSQLSESELKGGMAE